LTSSWGHKALIQGWEICQFAIHQQDGYTHINERAWQYVAALNFCTWIIAGARLTLNLIGYWCLTQNRRQKVFNKQALHFCGGALGLCGGARHSKNWQKFNWFIVFRVSIWGGLELCLGVLSPPMATGLVWRFIIRLADTLVCLQWYVSVLKSRFAPYTFFGRNKIKFGQTFFASPKSCTPAMAIAVLISLFLGRVVSLIWKRFFTWRSECKSFWSFLVLVEILGHQWSEWLI